MTIAEKNAHRRERLDGIKPRIRGILAREPKPFDLDEIVHYLQRIRLSEGAPLDTDNPFDIRDAISEMVRDGEVREVLGRDVELVRAPTRDGLERAAGERDEHGEG